MRVLAVGGLLLALAATTAFWRPASRGEALLDSGRAALEAGDPQTARALAEQALAEAPDLPAALLLAARASRQLQEFDQAIARFDRIPDDGTPAAVSARTESGQLRLAELCELSAAEQQFRRALRQDRDCRPARAGLAYVLGLTARPRQAARERLELIRLGNVETVQMYLLATTGTTLENPQELQRCAPAAADDPAVQLGQARVAIELQEFDRAAELLHRLATDRPDWTEVQALLGGLWLKSRSGEEFRNWHRALPESATIDPGVWFARAEHAASQGLPEAALRCYGECVQRDPNFPSGAYRLGQSLVTIGQAEAAAPFLERASMLAEYAKQAELAHRVGEPAYFRRCVDLAESLGLTWEAYGWAQAATLEFGTDVLPGPTLQRLQLATALLPIDRTAALPETISAFDFRKYPLPEWSESEAVPMTAVSAGSVAAVSFRNDAAQAGLQFQYLNGGDPLRIGIVHMYEVVGGGVAVIDYDNDFWPDVYFPQGGMWAHSDRRAAATDELFRNQGNGTFGTVTAQAGVDEPGFSQGATVGDFDGDGFADVYVANIGGNRLYRNNGDGTFSDVTATAGVGDDRYSTSAVIADFNGDALPEIFSLNYLSGSDLFSRVCGDERVRRSCLPQAFEGSAPRLYQNLGDGEFADASAMAGFTAAPARRGLGVVAGDLSGTGRVDIYVANDVGPNSLWIAATPTGTDGLFRDEGLLRGVALNRDGDYESGMGIAAADVDLDGRLDLFVTNFDDQTNTLYCQHAGGHFEDVTATAGFAPKRRAYVGWGTQFIDAELDGLPDLILTNGHVNDLRDRGQTYLMPAQFYSNAGERRFVERDDASLGPFFREPHLGRGMARIDWNRDGLEDVVISHLDAPAALLTNTTTPVGTAFACRLVGVRSARDPVAATVRVTSAGRTITRHWLAGDGNQSSNQRILVFATEKGASIEEVQIRWPSGKIDRYQDVPTAGEAVFVEGRQEWFSLPR